MAVGTQERIDCPKCGDTEKSMSVRQTEDGPRWRCFRASCGFVGGPRGISNYFSGNRPKAPRYYVKRTRTLTREDAQFFNGKFGFVPVAAYSPEDNSFVLGIQAPRAWNSYRGCVSYALDGRKPKTLTYNERPEEPFLHWAGQPDVRHIVVVEDWFSAEKIALTGRARGVSLQGTHIDQRAIYEIALEARAKVAKVHIALDKDAFNKGIGYAAKYGEQFPNGLSVWGLSRDLKYEKLERISEGLDGDYEFGKASAGSCDVIEECV